ncbi:uncharacterized protein CG13380 isoform X2 [Drosophila obscura]|uniref:uncharacterized protein CG13380 isoform X2 n=1 Tax=Drosophila obscura TaxID=7282 RepID=UPI001BB28CE7|nr:uncharacterized protein CG13380 isoform X2 [Drosophila obscura]
MEGTDMKAIFARLNSLYGNLNGSSPHGVTFLQPTPKHSGPKKNNMQAKKHVSVDPNNNLQNIEPDVQSKKVIIKTCICERPAKALECGRCHQYFHGRIAAICEKHPAEAFLMDFRECPYCTAHHDKIKVSELTWAQIRKIEDAVLPNDDL